VRIASFFATRATERYSCIEMLSHKTGEHSLPQPMSVRWILVRQAHAAGGFRSQVHPDAQKVRGTGRFTPLATDTVFGARRGSDLTGFAAIPGNHL